MLRHAFLLAGLLGMASCSSLKYASQQEGSRAPASVVIPEAPPRPPPLPPPPPMAMPEARPDSRPRPAIARPYIAYPDGRRPASRPTRARPRTTAVRGTTFAIRSDSTGSQSANAPVVAGQPVAQGDNGFGSQPEPEAEKPQLPSQTNPLLNLPAYPKWPPEKASTRIGLDYLIEGREGLSLYDAGQRLRTALREANYIQHSFYSVPGGFILVTDTEQISPEGAGYTGTKRYQMPGEGRDSWWLIIRDLFLERPDSFYRYIAIVVSDQPFSAVGEELTREEAVERLQLGNTDLGQEAREFAFTSNHSVTALIYEFMNGGADTKLEMISPGRLDAGLHLSASGLDQTIPKQFPLARMTAQVGQ